MSDIPDELKDCLKTEIIAADGEKLVLFHEAPLDSEELEMLSQFTSKEICLMLKGLGFNSYQVDNI